MKNRLLISLVAASVAVPSLANDFSHPICKIGGIDSVTAISANLPPVQKLQ